ncbi:hypothetical protein [Streptomyces sp. NPDC048643]|uniref:hypothetical protein n=1 Tax=Streptomyces sp. NPDC048643 TaxID=3155637 RepID=UPI003430C5F4
MRQPPATTARDHTTCAEYLALSVPAQTLRGNLTDWGRYIRPGTVVVSLIKGIETETGLRMSQVIHEVTGTRTPRSPTSPARHPPHPTPPAGCTRRRARGADNDHAATGTDRTPESPKG